MGVLISGAQSSATNEAFRRSGRATASDRLRGNNREAGLENLNDVMDVMDSRGSRAATLDRSNPGAFAVLASSIVDGAVAANLKAAGAAADQTSLFFG